MIESTYRFLDFLGLDESADARAIRRAYAGKLKLIDQEADAAGFQTLREAYEEALDWVAYAAPEPAAGVPAVRSEYEEQADVAVLDEAQLVATVWERFTAGMQELGAAQRLADPDAWHDLLLALLAKDEMINIGARMQFEARIVDMLADGWRPGHEALFPAAVDAFDWASDRRRLAQFSYAGHLLNSAIDERALFDSQAVAVRSVQERIAMLLRREKQAGRREIVHSMAELGKMQDRFPALLLVVTNPENVAHWEAEFATYDPDAPRVLSQREIAARWFLRIVLLIVTFKLLHFMYGLNAPANPEREPASWPAPLIQSGSEPTLEQLAEHIPDIRYQPPEAGPLREFFVAYDVLLGADGRVQSMNKRTASGDRAFDEAVEEVLRRAKPFPSGTARVFGIGFLGQMVETRKHGALRGIRSLNLMAVPISSADDAKSRLRTLR